MAGRENRDLAQQLESEKREAWDRRIRLLNSRTVLRPSAANRVVDKVPSSISTMRSLRTQVIRRLSARLDSSALVLHALRQREKGVAEEFLEVVDGHRGRSNTG